MVGAEAACWKAVKEHKALPDDWFPRTGPLTRANTRALEICMECPIQQACLTWAMQKSQSNYSLYGIWGGALPTQRKQMARSRR